MQASALWSAHNAQDDGFNAFVLAEMGIHVSDAGDTTARVKLISTVTQRSAGSTSATLSLYLHQAEALSRNTQHNAAGKSLNWAYDLWGLPPRERLSGLARPVWRGPTQVD